MISDWDDAYANGKYIAGAERYPQLWADAALAFRSAMSGAGRAKLDLAYGLAPRHRLDLFMPANKPHGLLVFVHGGYWLAFDKSSWSHLARGAVERGWAVALPSYSLAPEASVVEITREIAQAISYAAQLVIGPIRLAGHSAGGHLVTRMACANAPLPPPVHLRIIRVLTISGLHDLRPLLKTSMGPKLFRRREEAAAESPALLEPVPGMSIACWVGTKERPEFLRQTELLANIWAGFGLETHSAKAPNCHHFNVIEGLSDSSSEIVSSLLS